MKRLIVALILFINIADTFGQEVHGEPNVWIFMLNHFPVSEKWRPGLETHVRRNDWLNEQGQFLIRPFIDYHLNPAVTFTAGYTYIKTSPFGRYPLPISVPENNIWEQVTLNQTIDKVTISHRFRMEHRFIGSIVANNGENEIDGYNFTNRFRYRLTVRGDLGDQFYYHIFDEIWFHQDGLKPRDFDRNWVYAGLGYRVFNDAQIELGFLHQWEKASDDRFAERPTIQLTLRKDFNLIKDSE